MPGSGPAGRYDIGAYPADLSAIFAGLRQAENGLHVFRKKIEDGADATLLFWGDSTISGTARWGRKAALALVTEFPTHSVVIHAFGSADYDAAETLATGSTSATIHVWVFGVSGAVPQYGMGAFYYRALASIQPDAMILAHGINMKTYGSYIQGAYVSAIEQFRLATPSTPILAFTQHPNRDDTTHEASRNVLKLLGGLLNIFISDTVYQQFLDDGKPAGYYVDAVHQSDEVGNQLYVDEFLRLLRSAAPVHGRIHPSRFSIPARAQNLLANGNFATWATSPGVPDDWTGSGSIVCTKELTDKADSAAPWSVRMTGSGSGQTYITQSVGGNNLSYIKGKPVTLAMRMKKDTAGNSTIGRMELRVTNPGAGTVTYASNSYVTQQGGFAWWVLSNILVPADATNLAVRIYHDTNTTPDATYGCWLDQVGIYPGALPFGAR
jgi:hypothetical protein